MILSAATAAKWHSGHLRIVQQVHRRKPRSIFHTGQFLTGLFNPAGIRLSQTTSLVRRSPLAVVVPSLFSINRGIVPQLSKEVIHHTEETPVSGTLVRTGPFLNRGKPVLPLTRHRQVVRGLCPMIVPRKRTCQPRLPGRSETLTRKREHY